jgi:hypothetical protein
LNGLESLKDEYPIEHFKDDTEGMTVANIARLQKQLSGLLERAGQIKTHLQKCYDFVRYSRIPEIMDIEDLESVRIEGVGRLYLTSDYNVSTRAGRKQTVNASTLKAIIKKEVIAKGKEVPEDLFNVAPFTRSQITK